MVVSLERTSSLPEEDTITIISLMCVNIACLHLKFTDIAVVCTSTDGDVELESEITSGDSNSDFGGLGTSPLLLYAWPDDSGRDGTCTSLSCMCISSLRHLI